MSLKGLKDLAKAVNKVQSGDTLEGIAGEISYLLQNTIELEAQKENDARHNYENSTPYALHPSNLPACIRSVFYNFLKYPDEPGSDDHCLVSIQNHGTDRHERVQGYMYKMEPNLQMLDPRQESGRVRQKGIDTRVVEDSKLKDKVFGIDYYEFRCWNPTIGIWFKTDGIFKYKSIKGIFEFKTEGEMKWQKRFAPEPTHIEQATCYAMAFDLDYIFFMYEDRFLFRRKPYLIKIDPDKKELLMSRIKTIIDYVDRNELPPKEESRCKNSYCRHKLSCSRDECSTEKWDRYIEWKERELNA